MAEGTSLGVPVIHSPLAIQRVEEVNILSTPATVHGTPLYHSELLGKQRSRRTQENLALPLGGAMDVGLECPELVFVFCFFLK